MARRESSGERRKPLAGAASATWVPSLSFITRYSLNFENEQGDVVILRAPGVSAGPATKLKQQRVREVGSGLGIGSEEFLQARFAELFAGSIHSFQDAVGVKKNAVPGTERNFHGRIGGIRKKAEHQAVGLDFAALGFAALRAVTRGEKQRRVAGSGVAQDQLVQVDENVGRGDEVLLKFPAKGAIQTGEDARGIFRVRRLSRKSDLEHGGDQRRGHAVTGDVGDQDADSSFVDHEKIVEVAGDGAHRQVARCDFEARELRHFPRQYRGLNLIGDLQLFIDFEQPLFFRERTLRSNVSQAADKNEKADGFDISVRGQDLEVTEITFDHEKREDRQARENGGDFA